MISTSIFITWEIVSAYFNISSFILFNKSISPLPFILYMYYTIFSQNEKEKNNKKRKLENIGL